MTKYKTLRINGEKIQLHRYIWEQEYGPIPEGYVIHHIDMDTHNNDIANLQCITAKEHVRIHEKWIKDDNGEWLKLCHKCNTYKNVEIDFYKRKDRENNPGSCVCKDCNKLYCKDYRESEHGKELIKKAKKAYRDKLKNDVEKYKKFLEDKNNSRKIKREEMKNDPIALALFREKANKIQREYVKRKLAKKEQENSPVLDAADC